MRGAGVGFLRGALGDGGLGADERGPRLLPLGFAQGTVDGFHIVPVDVGDHLPAVRLEAPAHVVGEPLLDLALVGVDRDAVVVVDGDQLAEAQRAGERAGLVRDAFHHAAVAHEDVGVVIDDRVVGAVELGGEQALGERHADRVRDALAEGPGGRLDTRGAAALGVAGRLRAELAEAPQLGKRQVVAGEMQHAVEQHRAVAVREHEAVAVRPRGVGRVVAQVPLPERHRDLGHAHRHPRVARLCRLHRVHRERANGIG